MADLLIFHSSQVPATNIDLPYLEIGCICVASWTLLDLETLHARISAKRAIHLHLFIPDFVT